MSAAAGRQATRLRTWRLRPLATVRAVNGDRSVQLPKRLTLAPCDQGLTRNSVSRTIVRSTTGTRI
jgi:hypothetical protein